MRVGLLGRVVVWDDGGDEVALRPQVEAYTLFRARAAHADDRFQPSAGDRLVIDLHLLRERRAGETRQGSLLATVEWSWHADRDARSRRFGPHCEFLSRRRVA